MDVMKPHPQIFLFLGDSPADLGKPFVRLQEFYESPSPLFRCRLFTLQKFRSWYCRYQSRTGKFTYYRDFYGYNAPSHIVEAFFCLYVNDLTTEEMAMLRMLGNPRGKYYVIGSPRDSVGTIDHELSHAFFYLYPDYRKRVLALHDGYDLTGVLRFLKDNMYARDMYEDEITSYVAFDWPMLNRAGVRTRHLGKMRDSILDVYREYKERLANL